MHHGLLSVYNRIKQKAKSKTKRLCHSGWKYPSRLNTKFKNIISHPFEGGNLPLQGVLIKLKH